MENENKQIGKRINYARKQKKMSMKKLGELVNLHESTISRYEKGEIISLDIEKMKEFASSLGVTPSWLMGWEDENGNLINIKSNTLKFSNNLSKSDKHRLLVSGMYDTYKENISKYHKWFYITDSKLENKINDMCDLVKEIETIYIPFYDFDFDYFKMNSDSVISDLELLRDFLNDLNEELSSIDENDENFNDICNPLNNIEDKKVYLSDIYHTDVDNVSDEYINIAYEEFVKKAKKDNELFKKILNIPN